MSCEKQFCSRAARLFGGDPMALFAQDLSLVKAETTITILSSPFQFDLSFAPQGSNSFMLVAKFCLEIFSTSGGINNVQNHAQKFQVLPPSAVGQSSILAPGGPMNPTIYGVSLRKVSGNFVNSLGNPWGYYRAKLQTPIYVPPAWFIRMSILDVGGGPNYLQPGTIVRLAALACSIPTNFTDLP